MRDWFATLRKPRATWATADPMPCDSSLSRFPNVVAQTGNQWATGATSHLADTSRPTSVAQVAQRPEEWAPEGDRPKTAANRDFSGLVAQVAPVAQENDKAGSAAWCADDWRAYFEERAGIAEHDGGLSRGDAEQRAFGCCVMEWLWQHPPPASGPEHCAHCGQPLGEPGRYGVPFLTGDGGHVWLHDVCRGEWTAQRRREAAVALSQLGLTPRDKAEG
jgi:hypothetical protein